ncbi:MAG: cupredoxin domain-containing protein [Vicinamibacterales bacterium]
MTFDLTHIGDSIAAAGTALLVGLTVMSAAQQDPAAASAPFDSDEPRIIEVVARRFAFEPARIEVKEGERIRLVVTSADGVHGVAIKKFRVEKSVPRGGAPITIDFVASAAGEFPLLCSEYCGNGHDDMKGMLVVAASKQ